MKITFEKRKIKCDGVNCGNEAEVKLDINSYKGILFLCGDCFKMLQSIVKRNVAIETLTMQ